MVTGQDVITAAREYLQTPYLHQGRVKGVGIDCIGLPICVCWDLCLSNFNDQNYGEQPSGNLLCDRIGLQCDRIETPVLGCLLVFRIETLPQHCGIFSHKDGRDTLIHAYQGIDRVKEHTYTEWWIDCLIQAYALPGVEYR
jgi:hypothetical protein